VGKIRKSGGYRELRSFQGATLIYDATYWFCEKFINSRSRTVDQMIQAARSGRQNIAEGSRAAATSSQTELRLVNVARASLEELLLDYEDFIRQRHQTQWQKDDPRAQAVRQVARKHKTDLSDMTDHERAGLYAGWLENDDAFVRANALICLIHQTNYLLDQQIESLEKQFIEDGGYSEILAAKRLQHRASRTGTTNKPDSEQFPPCPLCGKTMVLRTAKTGKNAGRQFLGCSQYPECKGVKEL
jgi:four helix bundle suffix protein